MLIGINQYHGFRRKGIGVINFRRAQLFKQATVEAVVFEKACWF
jgi:hypothetical protein